MDTNLFFSELESYLKLRDIKGEIVNDSFSMRCYAVFGKDSIGYPSVFLDKEDTINGVDVLALEVHDSHRAEVELEQRIFIGHIFDYLHTTYKEREEGILLYKRLKRDELKFSSIVPSQYSTITTPNFLPVEKNDNIFSFLNIKMMEWCIHSNCQKVTSVFQSLERVKEALIEFQSKNPSRNVLIHNIHLVSSDTLYNKFVFESDGISYFFDFGQKYEEPFQIRIAGKPDYIPLAFSEDNLNFGALLDEIESLNSYIRLFEND